MKKLVLCILNILEKSDEVPTTSKLQSPGNFDPFPDFLNKVLLKNCSRLIYLWIAYGGFHCNSRAKHLLWAGPKGTIWLQSQEYLQSDALQKSFANPWPGWLRHMFKKKKKKKEERK